MPPRQSWSFPALLPGLRSGDGNARLAGNLCDCLSRPAHRLGALWPLWRPHWPQDYTGCRAGDNGPLHNGHRSLAHLSLHRSCRAAAARRLPLWPGLGLGGEWGGAVLLAVENAPPNKRAWYGMFPQLGAPVGFILSGAVFLLLSHLLTDRQFFDFGWRLPFLASSVLVLLGLYVRLTITETPAFKKVLERGHQVRLPTWVVFRHHSKALIAGILLCLATFVLFYLMVVFALSWGTGALHYSREKFLLMQLFATAFFALTIPVSALLAERGRRRVMLWITAAIFVFGLVLAPLFAAGFAGALAMLVLGLALMGLTYGPLGTIVTELFPTPVRYSGSSLAFNFAGIFGASLAPYLATWLATNYGLPYVGYYLCASAVLSFVGLLLIRETADDDLSIS